MANWRFIKGRRPNWSRAGSGHSGAGTGPTFVDIPEIDGWRSKGHALAPTPDREAVMLRVRTEVERLADSIDEGTARALDLLIESWVAQWLAVVDTAYIDACSVVDVHYGQAAQLAVEAESALEFEGDRLDRARRDLAHIESVLLGREGKFNGRNG
ncbi:hypothetical protein ACWDSJ_15520 [Nocardia sp. NPDC003482]